VPSPVPAATQQIARLAAAHALEEASLLTAMTATPRAIYFDDGTPEEVEAAAHKIVVRAARAGEIPVLVVNNLPYRDCAQYSAGGARDGAAYRAWFEGFVRGIGKERAVVILEPDSLGIIPNNTSLDGSLDWCHPTITSSEGKTVAAPGAIADERYALLAGAIDRLVSGAPNALIYLDGTHGGWVPVGEMAYRLPQGRRGPDARLRRQRGELPVDGRIGEVRHLDLEVLAVRRARRRRARALQGLSRPVRRREGRREGLDGSREVVRRQCRSRGLGVVGGGVASPLRRRYEPERPRDARRGRLSRARRSIKPPDVIQKLKAGDWCNAPSAGAGTRPTARTGVPLADAFVWVKTPGHSDGSCDIAGNTRAWDYARFNPWKNLRRAAAALRSAVGDGRSGGGRVVSRSRGAAGPQRQPTAGRGRSDGGGRRRARPRPLRSH
jgi:endoglucanase